MKRKFTNENLVLVESELQLRSYVDYCKQKKTCNQSSLIIRYNGNFNNDQRIKSCLGLNRSIFNKVYSFTARKNNKVDFLFFFIKFGWLVFIAMRCQCLFVGDYRSNWMRIIFNQFGKHIYFLDDGVATINFFNSLNDNKIKIGKPFSLISSLGITSTTNVDVIALKQCFKEKDIDMNKVVFVGMGLVEGGYMEESKYICYLENILRKYSGMEFEYIPHRIESIEKLEVLKKSFRFNINIIDSSIEEYLSYKSVVPGVVCSFYSTALINLANKISGPKIVSLKINEKLLRVDIQEQVLSVYKFYSLHNNIRVEKV